MAKIITLLKKDLLLELRQKHTFFGILLYVASTIFVLYLAMGQPESAVYNAIFWVIQLFVCINAVAKSFLQESKGRMLYFNTLTGPVDFIIAKLIYSTLFMLLMVVISLLLFAVLIGNPVNNFLQFAAIACFGGVSISLVFTLMAAIAARAQQNAAVMAILGFPLIIPQLLLLIRLSKSAFGEQFREGALLQITLLLIGLDVLVTVLAIVLFPFLWKE
ncbi:MAG TPA: heme exporter protein CcmB [Candidatus Babeliaceae bacterium]|nr:heme exporter protein CcmB [Candidatus Babeliaceae bacterium]HVZ96128.1 heme exporter protein CcmB [Chitinophagaceae bacterium]